MCGQLLAVERVHGVSIHPDKPDFLLRKNGAASGRRCVIPAGKIVRSGQDPVLTSSRSTPWRPYLSNSLVPIDFPRNSMIRVGPANASRSSAPTLALSSLKWKGTSTCVPVWVPITMRPTFTEPPCPRFRVRSKANFVSPGQTRTPAFRGWVMSRITRPPRAGWGTSRAGPPQRCGAEPPPPSTRRGRRCTGARGRDG